MKFMLSCVLNVIFIFAQKHVLRSRTSNANALHASPFLCIQRAGIINFSMFFGRIVREVPSAMLWHGTEAEFIFLA
jgi:hypothetical protein